MRADTTPSARKWWTMSLIASGVLPVSMEEPNCLPRCSHRSRQLFFSPRLPNIPFLRRWNGLRLWRSTARATVSRLWQEDQAGICRISCAGSLDGYSGALQRCLVHAQYHRKLRLHLLGRQRGRLQHLSPQFRYPSTRLRASQQACRSGHQLHHDKFAV